MALVRKVLVAAARVVRSNAEELAVAVGLVLITLGLWPHVGVAALVVPGAAIVWVWLPPRVSFLVRPTDGDEPRRKR
jgi:uncharacterized membrane protein